MSENQESYSHLGLASWARVGGVSFIMIGQKLHPQKQMTISTEQFIAPTATSIHTYILRIKYKMPKGKSLLKEVNNAKNKSKKKGRPQHAVRDFSLFFFSPQSCQTF